MSIERGKLTRKNCLMITTDDLLKKKKTGTTFFFNFQMRNMTATRVLRKLNFPTHHTDNQIKLRLSIQSHMWLEKIDNRHFKKPQNKKKSLNFLRYWRKKSKRSQIFLLNKFKEQWCVLPSFVRVSTDSFCVREDWRIFNLITVIWYCGVAKTNAHWCMNRRSFCANQFFSFRWYRNQSFFSLPFFFIECMRIIITFAASEFFTISCYRLVVCIALDIHFHRIWNHMYDCCL